MAIAYYEPVVPALAVGLAAHADPGVGVVEGAVVEAAVAAPLLGAEEVLEAAMRLAHHVARALVLARTEAVEVHLVFNHSLQNKFDIEIVIMD